MVAIVGGAGFLGSAVVRTLETQGVAHSVVDVECNPSATVPVLVADVRRPDSLFEALEGAESIINLAAVHRDDVRPRTLYDEVNVDGARNVCDAARRHGIKRIIFTSSVAIYGFAPPDTDEEGAHSYFNDYGRTKAAAEQIYRQWQSEDPARSLTIVRPTVIFGEGNRGNVYNLLSQMASGRFVMVGTGRNVKSMAYVENVASFVVHCLSFGPGVHVYNYVDKPDMTMNELVRVADRSLGRDRRRRVHVPYPIGYLGGILFDVVAALTGRSLPISALRVKKFCSTTKFAASKLGETGFRPPVSLAEGLERTIRYEFVEDHSAERTYDTE